MLLLLKTQFISQRVNSVISMAELLLDDDDSVVGLLELLV